MNKLYCKKNYSLLFLKKAGANLRHIFLNIRFLNTDDSERIKFADDWIQTADLFCQKEPLYQVSNNHCPTFNRLFVGTFNQSLALQN